MTSNTHPEGRTLDIGRLTVILPEPSPDPSYNHTEPTTHKICDNCGLRITPDQRETDDTRSTTYCQLCSPHNEH